MTFSSRRIRTFKGYGWGFMVVNNRKAQADLNPTSVALRLGLWVGMLLERWWSGIWLAPGRTAKRENHNRNEHPGDEEETEKDKTDDKTLCRLLNQMIQVLRHMGEINHRMMHTIL